MGIAPGEPASAAARETLAGRLKPLPKALRRAARKAADDVEFVHDLRVRTRRATAAMRLYRDFLPKRTAAWINEKLKQIRRATNDARDLDILAAKLAAHDDGGESSALLEELQVRREKAQREIRRLDRKLVRSGEFEDRAAKLLRKLRPRGKKRAGKGDLPFSEFARAHLKPLIEKFFRAGQVDPANAAALHRFRIRGKKLRYSMELLAPAFPAAFRERLYPIIEELQDMLGEINDYAAARLHWSEWLTTSDASPRTELLHELRDAELAGLEAARRNFTNWWTPSFQQQLRRRFGRVLQESARVS